MILGASGMLGNAALRIFAESAEHKLVGSVRSNTSKYLFPASLHKHLLVSGDIENPDALIQLFHNVRPQVVINCIGLIKQLSHSSNALSAIPLNAVLPHRIAHLCGLVGARLVHISTDCVFSGSKGGYLESDAPDAQDLYGRSKLLGEVDYPHAITLRTSIIGHELADANGLVGWFLKQQGMCRGYSKAIFSGLPTVELARVIRDFVLHRTDLHGVYHVASSAINKYELLTMVAGTYGKKIAITPDAGLVIDRSLNAQRFNAATTYTPPPWPQLVEMMHRYEASRNV